MTTTADSKITHIDVENVKKAIDENKEIILLDVRTAGEYAKGKIAGSINLPLDQIPEKITAVIPAKDSQIYIYCLSGSRSIVAAQIMEKLGYTHLNNMISGLLAWRVKGYNVS